MTEEEILQKIEKAHDHSSSVLDLTYNNLSELPLEIWQLKSLIILDLHNNRLSEISKEISRLTKLTRIFLYNNQLVKIPKEISNLLFLKELQLSNNRLNVIPKEVSRLKNLEELYLSDNQLTQIPKEISLLKNLRILSLANNQLIQIPKEISCLNNLKKLFLSGNPLTEIPQELSQLTHLSLYIDEAQLRNSAEIIVRLKNLSVYVWNSKEYNIIPIEIWSGFQTAQELLDYYFKPREQKLNEAKILIIGQGNVGKTSLRQRLMGAKDYSAKGRTEGVEIAIWKIRVNDEEVKLNIWDFGGQEIYHTTHQFFFRSRSLYLLVIDARLGEINKQVNYWLRQTQALGKNAPVIVVANKAEVHEEKRIDERYREIVTHVETLKTKFPGIVGCVLVSCEENLKIGMVRYLIARTIEKKMPEVFTKITKEEFAVKERLENENKSYISDEEFQEMCRDVPQENKEELVEILCALGVITNFDDAELKDTKVLKPEWITKGIYKILSSYKLGESNGRVSLKDIQDIFADDEEEYPPDKIKYILNIMEKHDLCFAKSKGGGKKELLFPISFPIKEPSCAPFGKNATHFEFQYKNIFFDSIIVRFLHFAYSTFGEKGCNYWRKGVEIIKEKNRISVKADEVESKIIIKIDGEAATREDLLQTIAGRFDEIHEDFGGLEVEKKIFHPSDSTIEFDYEKIKNRQESGKDFATYTNDAGEEIRVSIRYLLEGVEAKEIREDEIRGQEKNRQAVKSKKKVFIVHGHDGESKEKVARFVERMELEAIILHEQASGGKTIIEKIEEYSDVNFAIVLLTPDDVGGLAKNPENILPRARQNVIVELGYMIAKLDRSKVCLLNKGVEMPSDFYGVVYLELDDKEAWKINLAKEMKKAGLEVDMNKLY